MEKITTNFLKGTSTNSIGLGLLSGSAYYMMVDETVLPPSDCFLTIWEIDELLGYPSASPKSNIRIHVKNANVREYCRGPNIFYEAFYACRRGSRLDDKRMIGKAIKYVLETKRVLVELFAAAVRRKSPFEG